VDAAICLAEKARTTARDRSVVALFIITFLLAWAGIPGLLEVSAECTNLDTMYCPGTWAAFDFTPDEQLVSKMIHELIYTHSGIKIGYVKLKNIEILLWERCGIGIK
jgi:hypothetical protein